MEIPARGIPADEIIAELGGAARAGDIDPWSGKAFGLCYFAGKEHYDLTRRAYDAYFHANALNPGAYPSLLRMENEIVAIAASMLHGSRQARGSVTSGGTESILNAMRAYRDMARERDGVTRPEVILPASVHPAFEKAAHYFNIKPVHVPLSADHRADVDAARTAVTGNTVAIVGSAPCYPYGVVDPIPELAAIASERGIGCHVDACLGGFFLPWMDEAGYPVSRRWDFAVDGVTSISLDAHKYGYAPAPSSLVMYKSDKFRKHQFFVYSGWCGGLYGSPGMLGSRPGGAIAATWAAMRALGRDGYVATCKETMRIARQICDGINAIDGVHVIGEPDMCVYAWRADDGAGIDTLSLVDVLEKEGGWFINLMQNPPAAHHMTSVVHGPVARRFLDDLALVVGDFRAHPGKHPPSQKAAMYGMMATFDHRGKVDDLIRDVLLKDYAHKAGPKKGAGG
ncbi:MAG: aspartate aminotransferase family protein [Candidatus Lokiarchaeota archaeon]|nr:aspartate aminotransferase family protein [Candidatus Lokiarchaeota archaeon]